MMKFKHIPDKPTKRELDNATMAKLLLDYMLKDMKAEIEHYKTRDRLFKKLKLGVSKALKHRIISTKEE